MPSIRPSKIPACLIGSRACKHPRRKRNQVHLIRSHFTITIKPTEGLTPKTQKLPETSDTILSSRQQLHEATHSNVIRDKICSRQSPWVLLLLTFLTGGKLTTRSTSLLGRARPVALEPKIFVRDLGHRTCRECATFFTAVFMKGIRIRFSLAT
jgi:hypothetical protein